MKYVSIRALDADSHELGAIDGERLSIYATDDGELQINNGYAMYEWSDLVGPDYVRGTPVTLELLIVDSE